MQPQSTLGSPNDFIFLARDFAAQDVRFAAAFEVLRTALAMRSFPGCAAAVTHGGRLVAHKALGRFTYEPDSPVVTPDNIFDLASVTKVVATTAMAMILYDRALLELDRPVVELVPEFAGGDLRRREVTLRQLLAHSSGLPAYERLFLHATNRDDLLGAAFRVQLVAAPGQRADYSDIGFIVLGVALERLAGESLDRFCQREVFEPLSLKATRFCPPADWKARILPTATDPPPQTVSQGTVQGTVQGIVQGVVQDENARVMGGVAGHAGLFGCAEDLAIFAHAMLQGGRPIFRRSTIELFTQRQSQPKGTSRTLGWDKPSTPSQSGRHFSPQSYGHLGYTGTSLWIDPARQLSVTLLTNRTWPDCQNQAIRKVRPLFHDAVVEALETSV